MIRREQDQGSILLNFYISPPETYTNADNAILANHPGRSKGKSSENTINEGQRTVHASIKTPPTEARNFKHTCSVLLPSQFERQFLNEYKNEWPRTIHSSIKAPPNEADRNKRSCSELRPHELSSKSELFYFPPKQSIPLFQRNYQSCSEALEDSGLLYYFRSF